MQEFFRGMMVFLLYILPAAAVMLTARALVKIPDELFRKILHFILLGAYIPLAFGFSCWWHAAAFILGFAGAIYPILLLASRIPGFTKFTTERKKGEFVRSMAIALSVMAVSVTVCWGVFGDRHLVLACVYAWGVGDAFAALVGKQFGRHKIRWKWADRRKSWEGTAAMFLTSAVAVWIVLLLRGGMDLFRCAVTALAGAAVAALVEMHTKGGHDTFTCPAAAMLVILPLMKLLGG